MGEKEAEQPKEAAISRPRCDDGEMFRSGNNLVVNSVQPGKDFSETDWR